MPVYLLVSSVLRSSCSTACLFGFVKTAHQLLLSLPVFREHDTFQVKGELHQPPLFFNFGSKAIVFVGTATIFTNPFLPFTFAGSASTTVSSIHHNTFITKSIP